MLTPDDPVPDLLCQPDYGWILPGPRGRYQLETERQEGKEVRWFLATSFCLGAVSLLKAQCE